MVYLSKMATVSGTGIVDSRGPDLTAETGSKELSFAEAKLPPLPSEASDTQASYLAPNSASLTPARSELQAYQADVSKIARLSADEGIRLAQLKESAKEEFRKALLSCGYATTQVCYLIAQACQGKLPLDKLILITNSNPEQARSKRKRMQEINPLLQQLIAENKLIIASIMPKYRDSHPGFKLITDNNQRAAELINTLGIKQVFLNALFKELHNMVQQLEELRAASDEASVTKAQDAIDRDRNALHNLIRVLQLPPSQVAIALEGADSSLARYYQARNELIAAHLYLSINMARRYTQPGIDILDLIEEGNLGLTDAAEFFDPNRNNLFHTYAAYMVRKRIAKTAIELSNVLKPTVYSTTVEQSQATMPRIIRWPDRISEREQIEAHALHRRTNSPAKGLLLQERNKLLEKMLATLDARESEIISKRFGLGDADALTLEEIGAEMGVGKERVRQLQAGALAKLRKPEAIAILDGYAEEFGTSYGYHSDKTKGHQPKVKS